MRILIADDELHNRKQAESILKEYGECDLVDNGEKAFHLFLEARENNQAYDLICSDIQMPQMDGMKLLREIREYDQDVKIMLVSTIVDLNCLIELKKYNAIGCRKPWDKNKIQQKLNKLLIKEKGGV